MLNAEELALLQHYVPLFAAELRRVGVSEEDERWIHAGSDQRPTASGLDAELARLRALPTGFGVVAYCAWLGFDYETGRRDLSGLDSTPG